MGLATRKLQPIVASDGHVLDPVGQAMTDVRDELGGHYLFETEDGRVVGHAVGPDVPELVVRALLERSAQCLHAAASSRRYVALSAGQGIESLQLDDAGEASLIPVVAAGQRLGWLWSLTQAPSPGVAALTAAAARVGRAASLVVGSDDDSGHGWLTGTRASAPGAGATPSFALVVAVCSPEADAAQLVGLIRLAARRHRASDVRIDITTVAGTAFLVVCGHPGVPAHRLIGHADALLAATDVPVRAGASDPVSAQRSGVSAREQAELVLQAAITPGRCLTPGGARPHLLLRHVGDALSRTARLGTDPLVPLLEYDDRRGTDLAATLLAWLDAHGEVTTAAERLRLHPNTLRYRLSRALELLDDDLTDATARLEVHLRLRSTLRSHA